jgi:hypothetical protein
VLLDAPISDVIALSRRGSGLVYPDLAGTMLWFRWKTLSGSYRALMAARRS